jgi:protein TonB
MVEENSDSALPSRYRIGLALSLALLFHTLLLSGIPSPVREQKETHRESLKFELIPPGSDEASRPSPESAATDRPIPPIPRFTAEPVDPIVTRQKPAPPDASKQIASEPPAPKRETSENSSRSTANISDRAGEVAQPKVGTSDSTITRITKSPAEQDPYAVILATHLARQLEQVRVPAVSNLSRTVAMEVELQLLGNGALTRAKVLKSTGIEGIDEAAYRAALAASPYPRPPEEGNSQNRFEVELVFTPKRL